jgi:UDP-sugar pyrophosphorylase
LHTVGFILVAGGLGERLGYSGIKIELPIELTTGVSYLEYYIEQILAIQNQTQSLKEIILPLTIMVSDDTEFKTRDLLQKNNNFGMLASQISIIKQEKVPALMSNSADISMLNPYYINTKPHGHGDVHSLMYSQGVARKWLQSGVKWIVFFQDTNSLAFHTLAAMIGVSIDMDLDVNSLTIPRVAKQSIGAVTKLTNWYYSKQLYL